MTDYPKLNTNDLNGGFDRFFKTFGGLFSCEEQCACYLMGVLCAQVLSEQRQRYDNRQPFFRHLKDLNLDETEMRGLLPKMKSKLVEYEKDHFNWELEKGIAERFRRAGSPWNITKSEINFFFTLGLCEARLFSAGVANQTNISK
jgi:CRISPR-associated protein Csh1